MKKNAIALTALCAATLLGAAGVARADVTTDAAHDACVVGTWVQAGGGPGEWMQRRLPAQQLPITAQPPRGVMVLQRDGRYAASATELAVDAIQQDPGGFQARLRAQAAATGRWSTRDRQLLLEAGEGTFVSNDEAVNRAASRLRARHAASGQRGRMFYGCRGDHLTTHTEVRPGEGFPTHFVRVRGDGG